MTATVDPPAKQMARFVVMYDTPSDVDAFKRHYNDVHIPLAIGPLRDLPRHDPAARRGLIADAASARGYSRRR
ncbi:hypothetical protein [Sphaerisporangium perillae]|uniref:hypothetical protein n=1 Tax=Sphaerisporangium perillae TaxID=2935860 RepID=UPI00200FA3EB|nr:hypothetical protein [Sphaerisporangium perillae]